MNIVFHYFFVRTLADFAGYSESNAQLIAHCSQMVDDFNLTSGNSRGYVYVSKQPPDFFMEKGLAGKSILPRRWWFYPATTGISMNQSAYSVLNNTEHETYTLVPFHFIPATPLSGLKKGARYHYRCQKADGRGKRILIEELLEKHRDRDLIRFGMLLHTYADTYSHERFSGFREAENNVTLETIYDMSKNPPVSVSPSGPYALSPCIGHGKVGHAPDVCAFKFSYKEGKIFSRYNMDSFLTCAKNILIMMCRFRDRYLEENQWDILEYKLKIAANQCVYKDTEISNVNKLVKIWKSVFPHINYYYDCNKCSGVEIESIEGIEPEILESYGLTEDDMHDLFSERGSKARECASIFTYSFNDAAYRFNEYAYDQIYEVVHSYRPTV